MSNRHQEDQQPTHVPAEVLEAYYSAFPALTDHLKKTEKWYNITLKFYEHIWRIVVVVEDPATMIPPPNMQHLSLSIEFWEGHSF
jgi:predicted patatin/cPLA2 family phospholipase